MKYFTLKNEVITPYAVIRIPRTRGGEPAYSQRFPRKQEEDEALYLSGSQFDILGTETDASGRVVVFLEERQ